MFAWSIIRRMSSIYTRAELVAKIKAVDEQIAKAAQAESYSINSGMSSQSVKRQPVEALLKTRQHWQNMLNAMDSPTIIPLRRW